MSQSNGTPKNIRGAVENAITELSKPGPHDLTGDKTLREMIEDVIFNHVMDRIRHDFAPAILSGETAAQLWEKIANREHL